MIRTKLHRIPFELLLHLLSFVPFLYTRQVLLRVCKSFYALLTSPAYYKYPIHLSSWQDQRCIQRIPAKLALSYLIITETSDLTLQQLWPKCGDLLLGLCLRQWVTLSGHAFEGLSAPSLYFFQLEPPLLAATTHWSSLDRLICFLCTAPHLQILKLYHGVLQSSHLEALLKNTKLRKLCLARQLEDHVAQLGSRYGLEIEVNL